MAREKLEVEVLDDAVLLPLDDVGPHLWRQKRAGLNNLSPMVLSRCMILARLPFQLWPVTSRLRKARRLEQTFDLPPQGLALVMELLDELDRLEGACAALPPGDSTEDQH